MDNAVPEPSALALAGLALLLLMAARRLAGLQMPQAQVKAKVPARPASASNSGVDNRPDAVQERLDGAFAKA